MLHRRLFLKLLGAMGVVATAEAAPGCKALGDDTESDDEAISLDGYEYVVVGSGAGGGPLAANLARAGHRVLLLEAGDDQGQNPNYQVPAFHGKSTEDPTMRWDYFVKHYSDDDRAKRDTKFTWETPDGKYHVGPNAPEGSKPLGILYPRAGTLGGCTAHNAMITVYPHESDWKNLQTLDPNFAPATMRKYFALLERASYLGLLDSSSGHGFRGWLNVDRPSPLLGLRDLNLFKVIKSAAKVLGNGLLGTVDQLSSVLGRDLNANGAGAANEGLFMLPLATKNGKRNGPREYLVETVQKGFPLTILTGCLASRILFDAAPDANGKQKAIGVEFIEGKHLYRADPSSGAAHAGRTRSVLVSREVIVACGAYNTPQLLKLSGVGPREELAKFGIALKVELPGVGTNLQDRYEVGVVSSVPSNWSLVGDCTFGAAGDACLAEWNGRAGGPYTTNGIAAAIVHKSSVSTGDPDLFVFGGPSNFRGYYPGYSVDAVADKHHFTWAVLKAHTENRAGTVTLRSADPRDMPEIDFKYFDTGSTDGERDLVAVMEGVALARAIGQQASELGLAPTYDEVTPSLDNRDETLKQFVKDEAWGHHASCTCPIGADDDPMAVLDAKFRVRGTSNLRVVDASVFPKIPGFFIVTPIYMMSEKATDDILEDAGGRRRV